MIYQKLFRGIVLVLCVSFVSLGFTQNISFEHLTQLDGLPSPTITSITKDSYGFMWFGTRRGLVKFDGYTHSVFADAKSKENGKVTNFFVRAITQVNDSTLWISLDNDGLYAFNLFTETFLQIALEEQIKEHFLVYSIKKDKNNNVWIATSIGLLRFNDQLVFSKFYNPKTLDQLQGFDKNAYVNDIAFDQNNDVWLLLAQGYIGKITQTSEIIDVRQFSDSKVRDQIPNHGGKLIFDNNHQLWICTEETGLFQFDLVKNKIIQFSKENNSLPNNVIRDLCVTPDDHIWVATDGGGLLQYNPSDNNFHSFNHDPNNQNSISGNALYDLYSSEDNILWIGTYAAGININKKNKAKFELINNKGSLGFKMNSKSVLSFAELPDHRIIIGTDGGGINILDKKTNKIEFLTTENSDLHSNIINTAYFDSKGYLWIASYGQGICRYTFKDKLKRASKILLPNKSFWEIIEDNKGNLLFGSLNEVYTCQVEDSPIFKNELRILFEANFGIINQFYKTQKGLIWIGTSSMGLCNYDLEDNRLHVMKHDRSKTNSIESNNVTSILEDSEGKIWLGTEFGQLTQLIDFENNIVKTFPNENYTSINGILEDKNKKLWLSTDNGITRFDKDSSFLSFGLDDGVQSKEFNLSSSYIDSEGFFYFGGIDGFNKFNPQNINLNHNIPSVYISDIKLFNQSIFNAKKENRLITKAPFINDKIELKYKENVFSISFASLDYLSPDQNNFMYMLEGFDNEWVHTKATKREANYTNLRPGTYHFKVKGSNNDGIWNPVETSLQITILPPWWMTWWFRTLFSIAVLLALITIYYIRLHNIKSKNKELEKLVEIKTSELQNVNDSLQEKNQETLVANEKLEAQNNEILRKSDRIQEQQQKILIQNSELEEKNSSLKSLNETKDKFFSIVAHDLKNPISAVYSLSELLARNYKIYPDFEKEQFVQQILQSSGQLRKLTVDLLDWASSQSKQYKAHFVSTNLHSLIDQSMIALDLQAKQKNILISNDSDPLQFVWVDEKMMDTVIRNLISNAIKFSPKGKVISIRNVEDENDVVFYIQDEGVGMNTEQLNHLFDLEHIKSNKGTNQEEGVGLGLVICKEFITLNDGNISFESNPNQGTKVIITLQKADFSKSIQKEVISEEPLVSEQIVIKESAQYTGRKILIIDDDPQLRKILQLYLSDIFEVYEAEDGSKGLELATSVFPELIICDLNMPVMNGFEFCTLLKENHDIAHIPCLILTAQTEIDVEKRAFDAGADAFLSKPYDSYLLIRRIINLLKSKDQIKAKFGSQHDFKIETEYKDKVSQDFLIQCTSYVESRMSDPDLHADDMCKELGLSKTLLYEKIKSLTGQTVNEFIKIIRLNHSISLLKEGRLNKSQIALEVGFNSLSYFTRSFTKQYGKSPSDFIKG